MCHSIVVYFLIFYFSIISCENKIENDFETVYDNRYYIENYLSYNLHVTRSVCKSGTTDSYYVWNETIIYELGNNDNWIGSLEGDKNTTFCFEKCKLDLQCVAVQIDLGNKNYPKGLCWIIIKNKNGIAPIPIANTNTKRYGVFLRFYCTAFQPPYTDKPKEMKAQVFDPENDCIVDCKYKAWHVQEGIDLTIPSTSIQRNVLFAECRFLCMKAVNCTAVVLENIHPFESVCYLYHFDGNYNEKKKKDVNKILFELICCNAANKDLISYKDYNVFMHDRPAGVCGGKLAEVITSKVGHCNKKVWRGIERARCLTPYKMRPLSTIQECLNACSESEDCSMAAIDFMNKLCMHYLSKTDGECKAQFTNWKLVQYSLMCCGEFTEVVSNSLKQALELDLIEITNEQQSKSIETLPLELLFTLIIGILIIISVFASCFASFYFKKHENGSTKKVDKPSSKNEINNKPQQQPPQVHNVPETPLLLSTPISF